MNRQFLFIGYCGRGNVGDDALAFSLLHLLSCQDSNIRFALLSPTRIQLEDGLQAKVSLVRQGPVALLKEAARATDVVLAGGTHFHDFGGRLRWAKVLIKYLLLFAWCKLLRKRITFINIGVGSLSTWWGKLITRLICALADDISVREHSSFKLLQDIGFAGKTKLAFDTAAYFVEAVGHLSPTKGQGIVLGVSLLPYGAIYHQDPQRDYKIAEAVAAAVNWLSRSRPELSVSIFTFNTESREGDLAISRYLHDRLQVTGGVRIIEYQNDPTLFLHQFQQCNLFLSMRLHAILFAYLSGIPQVIIPYHPKCNDVAQEIQMPAETQVTEERVLAGELPSRLESLYLYPNRFCAELSVEEARKRAMAPLADLVIGRNNPERKPRYVE